MRELAAALTWALLLTAGPAGAQPPDAEPPPDPAGGAATVVFLVRHAEPVFPPPPDAPRDPPLAEAGRERAERLAHVLHDASIARVFSTDFRRTQETAAPLAERLDLDVEPYDPDDLAAFAESLAASPGRVLVVGHSNTTPELVGHLGGDPGEAIDEKREFDRLYVVVLRPGQPVETLLLHYGSPPEPASGS